MWNSFSTKIHPVIFYTVFTWNLDLLKILFQNQIMIQNPQKSRYFRSGNCFGKLSSNSFWKLWKEKFYLCFIRRNDSQNVEFFFTNFWQKIWSFRKSDWSTSEHFDQQSRNLYDNKVKITARLFYSQKWRTCSSNGNLERYNPCMDDATFIQCLTHPG